MKAAVVTAFEQAPRYQDHPEPSQPQRSNDGGGGGGGGVGIVVDVLAAGLHPRVRSQADGSHYTSTDELPLVPGIDGVGRDREGNLRYFVLPDTPLGAMAERTLIDPRRSVILPAGSDPIAIAAAMNPAMSSWIALGKRIHVEAGASVLILGATGNAGRMAIEIAKRFGAARIIAAGRDASKLADLHHLGATEAVTFDKLGNVAGDVDVALDYLWGPPAADAMAQVITARPDRGRPLTWIQIGSIAGATAAIPSAALRASALSIIGSGQGSVSTRDIVSELPALAAAIGGGAFHIDAQNMPLAEVERAWAEAPHTARRIVLTP